MKRKKIASLILSPNQSAMLHNPIFKSYNNNTPTFEDNSSTIIQEFLSQLSIFTLEKFEPFKALCCNGTIINCSAIYEQYNYYEEYKKSGKDIAFINLENMEGVDLSLIHI
ncbi:MAG: hypothetical protein N2746_02660, partial [Deltaproteobacteria bacterium]|nr:hypothetical protein [Deltaproteobacteria bacterium]